MRDVMRNPALPPPIGSQIRWAGQEARPAGSSVLADGVIGGLGGGLQGLLGGSPPGGGRGGG